MYPKQRLIVIILIIVLAIVMAFVVIPKFVQMEKEEQQLLEETTVNEDELRPLEAERAKLQRQLSELDDSKQYYDLSLSSTMIIVTDPDERVMDDIVPTLDEKGYKGVLCVNEKGFPGKDGMMSVEDAKSLVDKGWEIAIKADENTNLYDMYFRVKNAGLGYVQAVYLPEAGVSDYIKNESADLLIPMIIQHRSNDSNGDDSHVYVGTVGATEQQNKKTFEDAVTFSEPLGITFGYSEDRDIFTENKLQNIILSIDAENNAGTTKVCNIKETISRLDERDSKIESGEVKKIDQRQVLENKISEIEKQIEELK